MSAKEVAGGVMGEGNKFVGTSEGNYFKQRMLHVSLLIISLTIN